MMSDLIVKSPLVYSASTQLIIALLVSTLLFAIERDYASSYLIGAIIYIVPNLYFVHYAYRYRGSANASLIARSFIWGESGKLALAAAGFIVAFRIADELNHPALFVGFVSMIVLQWFVAVRIAKLAADQEQTKQ